MGYLKELEKRANHFQGVSSSERGNNDSQEFRPFHEQYQAVVLEPKTMRRDS